MLLVSAKLITTEFTQPMYVHVGHTDWLGHTREMVVVETIWQLHTLIVVNPWLHSLHR